MTHAEAIPAPAPSAGPAALAAWHAVAASLDPAGLDALLADDVVFISPVVHTPQIGKPITKTYLTAALRVLGPNSFRYLGTWYGQSSAVLEFEAEIDGITINGIDMIAWDETDRITRFKVMVRPLKAINLLHQRMGAMLMLLASEKG